MSGNGDNFDNPFPQIKNRAVVYREGFHRFGSGKIALQENDLPDFFMPFSPIPPAGLLFRT
jgi:hypothetical protein